VRDASFTGVDQDLTVSRWIWSSTDAHCCPSKEAEERYRWGPGGRFVRVGRAERRHRSKAADPATPPVVWVTVRFDVPARRNTHR
jgi:hypothetical protein